MGRWPPTGVQAGGRPGEAGTGAPGQGRGGGDRRLWG